MTRDELDNLNIGDLVKNNNDNGKINEKIFDVILNIGDCSIKVYDIHEKRIVEFANKVEDDSPYLQSKIYKNIK